MSWLIAALWIGLAGWVLLFLWLLRNARGYPMVSASTKINLRRKPSVSILIPARNEAAILSTTLPKFLAQDYDDYEVILVDDASTDGTGKLAQELARAHPGRLRVIPVKELPPGWVGKTHALHQGFQAATGEWVLATDADIEFHPQALAAGLWLAEREKAELVSIYPYLDAVSFWEKMMMPGFSLVLSAMFPVHKINDPHSSVALASGGYILMRRSLWAGLGGYEAIRTEMIDDLNTARLVKHSGHRVYVAATKDLLHTRMYHNLRELWEGLRKNAFAAHRYSIPKMVLTLGGYLLFNVVPLVCVAFYGGRWPLATHPLAGPEQAAFLLSLAQLAVSMLIHLPVLVYLRIPLAYALLAPLAAILYILICMDSMAKTLFGRGVSWKMRQYGRLTSEPKGG